MKRKIKLTDLKVKSFVTSEKQKLSGEKPFLHASHTHQLVLVLALLLSPY
ncbi:pinensin family lanthipeptide [Fulvivirga sp. 29W222]|uniref:Pinensin family lanthipeptide n=1 Tax=Fulvivirga marina TaxID=2494733 RepID=A0A937FTR4_9BACT|nr:pinensin family lanthipeptide [Fulvivirga marina]